MISLNEVKEKSRRVNSNSNSLLHFFASKFSLYFSWMFINLGLSANQVTGVFFLTGLSGALALLVSPSLGCVIAYIAWRLHIIIDLSDGDVARFNKTFSVNGAYWDYMAHSVLYPLYFACFSVSAYLLYDEPSHLVVGCFGSIVLSQTLSVKNNYYRAMLFNRQTLDLERSSTQRESGVPVLKQLLFSVVGFEGYLAAICLVRFIFGDTNYEMVVSLIYILLFFAVVARKFFLFSRDGYYERRS